MEFSPQCLTPAECSASWTIYNGCGQLLCLSGFVKKKTAGRRAATRLDEVKICAPRKVQVCLFNNSSLCPVGSQTRIAPGAQQAVFPCCGFQVHSHRLKGLWESLSHRLWLGVLLGWRHCSGLSSVPHACVFAHFHTFKLKASWPFLSSCLSLTWSRTVFVILSWLYD